MKRYFIVLITVLIIIFFISIFLANLFWGKEADISKLNASIEKTEVNSINIVTDSTEILGYIADKDEKKIENEQAKGINSSNITKVEDKKEGESKVKISSSNKTSNMTTQKFSSSSTTKENSTKDSNKNIISSKENNASKVPEKKPHVHSQIGNCGRWFSSFDEFVRYFNYETKRWDNLYDSGQINWESYVKNCPVGYQNVHNCLAHFNGNSNTDCGLLTGDFVYQKK